MNPILFQLIRVLARLYPDVASTTFFIAASGINAGRIFNEQAPLTRWFYVISEADKDGKIPQVLAVALADYEKDEDLLQIADDLMPVVETPKYDLTRVIPPTETGREVDRIVGGALTTSFPDCVVFGNEREGYFCSGVLIAPNVVISAKHCADTENTRVFLKGHSLNEPEGGEIRYVERRILHPAVDLLLLILSEPSTVIPRRIATTAEIDSIVPMTTTLVGWGHVDFQGTVGFGTKRRVEVPITVSLCGGEDVSDFGCIPDAEFVAGHKGLARDTCFGDSGGGAYIQNSAGDYLLMGVTSRGIRKSEQPCGHGGIYIRVDKFLPWISENSPEPADCVNEP